MGWRQARQLQDRVQLDTLVRLKVLGPPNSEVTGLPATLVFDGMVWCSRKDTESELDIGGDRTTLTFPSSIIVRWDERWESLTGKLVSVFYPETSTREDRIANVEHLGRRRFLKLTVEA